MLFSISQGFSVPYQFLFQEQVELDAVLRTEIMGKGTCLDSSQWLPSMTLFSVSNLVCIRLSIFILCNGWVIILLKIYKPAFLLIKYPCSTRDPMSFFLSLPLANSLECRNLLSSLSCPGFQDLFERTPCASMSGTSPVLGLYWFSA